MKVDVVTRNVTASLLLLGPRSIYDFGVAPTELHRTH